MSALPGAGRHFVYSLYAGTPDEPVCVYVGVTSNLRARVRAHAKKWWARTIDLNLSEFEEYPTRSQANAEELRAIRLKRPHANIVGVPGRDDRL